MLKSYQCSEWLTLGLWGCSDVCEISIEGPFLMKIPRVKNWKKLNLERTGCGVLGGARRREFMVRFWLNQNYWTRAYSDFQDEWMTVCSGTGPERRRNRWWDGSVVGAQCPSLEENSSDRGSIVRKYGAPQQTLEKKIIKMNFCEIKSWNYSQGNMYGSHILRNVFIYAKSELKLVIGG